MKCEDWAELSLSRQYRKPKKPSKVRVKSPVSFDCETNKEGYPYLIYASDGRFIHEKTGLDLDKIIEFLTYTDYQGTLNTFFNLQFDASCILKSLPQKNIVELWETSRTKYGDYFIHLIPKKYMSFTVGKKTWAFFDICQFYNMSLNAASARFLNDTKHDIDIKNFENIGIETVKSYCYQDAKLTQRLTQYFLDMLDKIDCRVNKLYSTAYISQKYFINHCDIPRLYYKSKWADYAFQSYAGGRFEVFKRGYTDKAYLYDINSAYPKYISELADLRYGIWDYKTEYDDNAYYAFVKARFHNDKERTPIPFKEYQLKIFPKGDYGEIYLSKSEYEYLENNGYNIEFIDGYFWKPEVIIYPFKDCVNKLYEQRQQLKKEGNPLEHAIKIILNSLYGKFIQITPHTNITTDINDCDNITGDVCYKTVFETGNLFNPVYAALITAGTRMQLFNARHDNHVLAYATDSILSDCELNLECDNALGNWKIEDIGQSIIIGSGVYILNGKKHIEKFRGFGNTNKYNLETQLRNNTDNKSITLQIEKPVTMGEAIKHNKIYSISDISSFRVVNKTLDINFDKKRNWDRNFKNCGDALKNNIGSEILDLDEQRRESNLKDIARYRPTTDYGLHKDYWYDSTLSRHELKQNKRDALRPFYL